MEKRGFKMQISAVLFDLDGTLLPMDQDEFVNCYFKLLAEKFVSKGYEPKRLIKAVWAGTADMVRNNGPLSNEEVFWNKVSEIYGDKIIADKPLFDEFYKNDFQAVKNSCGYNEQASETVRYIKSLGIRTALATNPIFPAVATESRIRWAGLIPDDFELYTTYENTSFCKPNPQYYIDILNKLDVKPEECIMVGNDVTEDMVAQTIGMNVFLLEDCLINKEGKDISVYPSGTFKELIDFIQSFKG